MVLINLVPISRGGGLQNALSFLSCLIKSPETCPPYMVVCVSGGAIEQECKSLGILHTSVGRGLLDRLWFELSGGRRLVLEQKAQAVFTLFGAAPRVPKNVKKISGFAYSNIIQSEIAFWDFLPLHRRLQKLMIDFLRLKLARRCDELIVETDFLAQRAKEGVFRGKCVHVVHMSPSAIVLNGLTRARQKMTQTDILYLAGSHPNKRIHLLAEVFSALNKEGHKFNLITTLDEQSSYHQEVAECFRRVGMAHALRNIGPVAPKDVSGLLSNVDAVVNVALLESFSNNWVEAWAANLPLIATDADWCRHSCGDAAIFIDPLRPEEAAARISNTLDSPEAVAKLRESGRQQLSLLPTPQIKFDMYMKIIHKSLDTSKHRK